MRRSFILTVFLTLGCLFFLSNVYAGQSGPPISFQADYIHVSDGEETSGKYFAGPEGIRIEELIEGDEQIMIINFSEHVTWVIMEEDEIYYEIPFNPEDSEDFTRPCPELTQNETMVGRETLYDRSVEKWHCEKADGSVDKVWYDTRLNLPIRTEENGDLFELRNIRETDISSDLFQPPAGYTRLSIPGMQFDGGLDPDQQDQEGGFFGGSFQGMDLDEFMNEEEDQGILEGLRGLFGG